MPATKPKKLDPAVDAFLAGVTDPDRKADCVALVEMMRQVTACAPRMWGTIVGFGDRHYRYASGREGDTFVLGFAARKTDLTLYLGPDLAALGAAVTRIGKHKAGKGCLYLRRLADANAAALRERLAAAAARHVRASASGEPTTCVRPAAARPASGGSVAHSRRIDTLTRPGEFTQTLAGHLFGTTMPDFGENRDFGCSRPPGRVD